MRLALIAGMVAVVAACGSVKEGDAALRPATARGLAAAVIEHLDAEPSRADGGQRGPSLEVMVSAGDVEVFVQVGPTPAVGLTCDRPTRGPAYRVLVCQDGEAHDELSVRASSQSDMPAYEAWHIDAERGDVLVELFGDVSDDHQSLIEDIVADPLLGLRTSAANNEAGEDIDDFGTLELTTEVSSFG